MPMPAGLYGPLNSTKREVRLLKVLPDQHDGKVHASLTKTTLADAPSYAALSYVWGDPKVTEDIVIDGHVLPVTTNLATALRHVRSLGQSIFPSRDSDEFLLWADAVCVNQADVVERNSQVLLMAELFSCAEVVLAWLGGNDPLCHLAFDFYNLFASEVAPLTLEEIGSMDWIKKYPLLREDTWERGDRGVFPGNQYWSAAINLLELEYWTRVWIYQETALAKRLMLCTKTRVLDYAALENSSKVLRYLGQSIRQNQIICPDHLRGTSIWYCLAMDWSCWHLISQISLGRRYGAEMYGLEQTPGPWEDSWALSLLGRKFRATDPKDHIYGLVSLSKIKMTPDYSTTKSVAAVYCEYVAGFLEVAYAKAERGDVLHPLFFLFWCGTGIYQNTLELPSWTPNFPQISAQKSEVRYIEGTAADQGVFPADKSGATVLGSVLNVTGVAVDSVARVQIALSQGSWCDGSLLSYLEDLVARKQDLTSTHLPLRTALCVLRRVPASKAMSEHDIRYAFHLLEKLIAPHPEERDSHFVALGLVPPSPGGDGTAFDQSFLGAFAPEYSGPTMPWQNIVLGEGASLNREDYNRQQSRQNMVADMVKLDKEACWRFIETSRGHLGLGPIGSRPGDLVYVLSGLHYPVILRRQRHDSTAYTHVGASFIDGLMEGEAAELVKTGQAVIEDTALV
jgi:hypothetical protein